ncbi:MBL fold metallo-hydrolase [Ornithinimicrobium sediminis]|uniref:MBL fold metallo-hydrolase n=1 Tax=Ornithinimicrobium sediminis TaxID=2904603 RepID=UPI0038CD393D
MLLLRSGLWAMESSSSWGCNSYLIDDGRRVFLVDPGPSFQMDPVARELRASGRSPYDLTDILLTHYDQDHSRSAAEWRHRTQATVWLGADDAEILRTRKVPGPWFRRCMMALLGLANLPQGTVAMRGETVIAPGLTAVPSPGHTPGHYAFIWHDVALIGDAARTSPDGGLVRFKPRGLATDPALADRSRHALANLPVRVFCPGHGPVADRTKE